MLVRRDRWEAGYTLAEVTLPTELFAWMSHVSAPAWVALSYLAAHGGPDGLTEEELLNGSSLGPGDGPCGPLRADAGCGLTPGGLDRALGTLEHDVLLVRRGTDGRWRVRWGNVLGA